MPVRYQVVAPAAESAELVKANEDVDKTAKRLKCSSTTLKIFGGLWLLCTFYSVYKTRDIIRAILNGGKEVPHTKEEEMSWGKHGISRDEFALYDLFHICAFLIMV